MLPYRVAPLAQAALSAFTPISPFFSLLLLSAHTRELELKIMGCFDLPQTHPVHPGQKDLRVKPSPSDGPPASSRSFPFSERGPSLLTAGLRNCRGSHTEGLNFFQREAGTFSWFKTLHMDISVETFLKRHTSVPLEHTRTPYFHPK